MSDRPKCLPPEGTPDDTLHFLSGGAIWNMFMWRDGKWEVPFSGYGNKPEFMAYCGWQYARPAQ
jgi:hypothetical protein